MYDDDDDFEEEQDCGESSSPTVVEPQPEKTMPSSKEPEQGPTTAAPSVSSSRTTATTSPPKAATTVTPKAKTSAKPTTGNTDENENRRDEKAPMSRIHEVFKLLAATSPKPPTQAHRPSGVPLPPNCVYVRGAGENQFGTFELLGTYCWTTHMLRVQRGTMGSHSRHCLGRIASDW